MAWVRPKHPKNKRKDPAEAADSLRPILQYFSGGHVPRPNPRPRFHHSPPQPIAYIEEAPWSTPQDVSERPPQEELNSHAFSFSRDRLVPITPKQSNRSKIHGARASHQQQIIQRPMTYHSREPSPPPPRSSARVAPKNRPPIPRQHVAADTSRTVSSRWESATTPLRL